jgi:ribosome-associated toxin RatA of RatAB toxin-antitoxin module
MELSETIFVAAPPSAVFELVDDPERYNEFFVGVTRWEPRSKKLRGVGARFRVLMQVGSIQAGGTVKVTERTASKLIRWESEQGIHQAGCWTLEKADGGTNLSLEIDFDLTGGPVGALVSHLAGRIVARNMRATLMAARRIVERKG